MRKHACRILLMRKRFGREEEAVRKKLGCEEKVLLTRKIFYNKQRTNSVRKHACRILLMRKKNVSRAFPGCGT